MKALLASSLGGSAKINGARVPTALLSENNMLSNLKEIWPNNAKILIICADPDAHGVNDSIYSCMHAALSMSGLSVVRVLLCDGRNTTAVSSISEIDVVILVGGHVPTQNRFLNDLQLKEYLLDYKGLIVAWSAGAMNCADPVYAAPELAGEASDPNFKRWITGLGITSIPLLPHYQAIKNDILDDLRLIDDIAYADSYFHEILAINDGSYLIMDDARTTLYGEAYQILNGVETRICTNGESIIL